MTEIYNNTYLI